MKLFREPEITILVSSHFGHFGFQMCGEFLAVDMELSHPRLIQVAPQEASAVRQGNRGKGESKYPSQCSGVELKGVQRFP